MTDEKLAEEWYVILNMNCKYEICRRCPKSGLFKGSLKECDDWIKQKQKDEIKDKISMALKDPILQQGFEVICKENAELDCQMNRNKYCYSCVNATDRCFRNEIGCPCEKYKSYKDEITERKAQIKLLTEKVGFWEEQTKLKKAQIEEYDRLNMFDVARTDELREKAQKQLTKAKELIKEMLSILPKENIEGVYEITEEAEQFIREV